MCVCTCVTVCSALQTSVIRRTMKMVMRPQHTTSYKEPGNQVKTVANCVKYCSPPAPPPISLSHATKDTVMLPHVEPFFVPTSMSAPFAARMTGAWPVISRAIFFLSGGSRHLSPLGVSGRACSVLVSLRSTHGTRQGDAFRQFPDNVFSGYRTNVLRL